MKPQTRIALIKMAEKAKRVQAEEYAGRSMSLGYVGAVVASLIGVYLMSSAIVLIAKGGSPLLAPLYLLVTLVFTLSPWYFIVRYNFNRNLQLLCEAILSVNQNDNGAG